MDLVEEPYVLLFHNIALAYMFSKLISEYIESTSAVEYIFIKLLWSGWLYVRLLHWRREVHAIHRRIMIHWRHTHIALVQLLGRRLLLRRWHTIVAIVWPKIAKVIHYLLF